MARIEADFEEIRKSRVLFRSFNLDALSPEGRAQVLDALVSELNGGGVRVLLHSIAFGSLKLTAPQLQGGEGLPVQRLAETLGLSASDLQVAVDELFSNGDSTLASLASPARYESERLLQDDELAETIYAMGTSLYSWTRDLWTRKMFSSDARVLGLTSEGNEVSWLGYAAVSAAKVALESISRSIAKEFAPYGIRSNILQPGVTDTPALRMIPGNAQLRAHAIAKNPFGRLTRVEDVANVVALLASADAAWINGSIIRVDGGERISG